MALVGLALLLIPVLLAIVDDGLPFLVRRTCGSIPVFRTHLVVYFLLIIPRLRTLASTRAEALRPIVKLTDEEYLRCCSASHVANGRVSSYEALSSGSASPVLINGRPIPDELYPVLSTYLYFAMTIVFASIGLVRRHGHRHND